MTPRLLCGTGAEKARVLILATLETALVRHRLPQATPVSLFLRLRMADTLRIQGRAKLRF